MKSAEVSYRRSAIYIQIEQNTRSYWIFFWSLITLCPHMKRRNNKHIRRRNMENATRKDQINLFNLFVLEFRVLGFVSWDFRVHFTYFSISFFSRFFFIFFFSSDVVLFHCLFAWQKDEMAQTSLHKYTLEVPFRSTWLNMWIFSISALSLTFSTN